MTSLRDAFDIKVKQKRQDILNDYQIFPDKKLLDNLRTEIVEALIDHEMPSDMRVDEWINEEIDRTIEGYDLSNLERAHLFNLIDNEINGNGPISELLEDDNITEIMVNSPDEIYIYCYNCYNCYYCYYNYTTISSPPPLEITISPASSSFLITLTIFCCASSSDVSLPMNFKSGRAITNETAAATATPMIIPR